MHPIGTFPTRRSGQLCQGLYIVVLRLKCTVVESSCVCVSFHYKPCRPIMNKGQPTCQIPKRRMLTQTYDSPAQQHAWPMQALVPPAVKASSVHGSSISAALPGS